jgi:hypothetical protein
MGERRLRLRDRAPDLEPLVLQVHVRPLEADHLADAEARGRAEEDRQARGLPLQLGVFPSTLIGFGGWLPTGTLNFAATDDVTDVNVTG